MDFTLSKQQQMVQKMYREFAENEVKPLAKKVDAEEYFPKETVEKMGKLGMMGIYFPTEVGGAGGDVLSYVMAVEELSKVCGTTGVIVSAHTSLCAAPIYENGTPEQKAKYLPKLCSGEWLGAFGLTEPGAGTDAQGQQTIAKEEDDCWVLNGSKIFITNAGFADVFIVIAVTDRVLDKKGRPTKLCSAFIVERTDPGFSVGKAEDKMGIRGSSTCELIFEDCRIPKDRMLGVRGKGFQLAMATLDGGRIGIASQALGIAEGALDQIVKEIRPGVTEKEIAARLQYLMLAGGAENMSFDPIVASGPNGSMPHAVPTDRRIQDGDFVTMDFGCIYHGYCSDMTRTVAVGSVTDEMRQVYDTVLQAQLAGIAAARAGATGKAVDGAARDIIRQAGYGPCFGHSFGHGVGVEIHEGPNATPSNDKPLPAGAVISAEPGIYLPGKLGVRIEDVLYLTPEGCQNLTLAPKELVIL